LHGNAVPVELVDKYMLNNIDTFNSRFNKDVELVGKYMLNNIDTCRYI
jgi:hypothetical protein